MGQGKVRWYSCDCVCGSKYQAFHDLFADKRKAIAFGKAVAAAEASLNGEKAFVNVWRDKVDSYGFTSFVDVFRVVRFPKRKQSKNKWR